MKYEAKIQHLPGGPILSCWCAYCERSWQILMCELDPDGWMGRLSAGMILCLECGCKRCPRATYHDHECTGSNEAGQHGSAYGDFRLPGFPDEDES